MPPQWGYPDTGCGRYGKALPYADWYAMNNGQRAQINFLEQFTFIVGMAVIAALYKPCAWYSFAFLVVYWVGRLLFSLGYTKAGPNARLPGAIAMDLAILALLCTAIASFSKLIQQTN